MHYTGKCNRMRLATIFLSGRTSMSQVILTVLLVLSGCSWTPAGGQTCSLSGKKIYSENVLQAIVTFFTGTAYNQLQFISYHIHAAVQFSLNYNVTVNADSVDGLTPAARVTWNTTVPPECVRSVKVEFRTSSMGPAITSNTTTNTSQTEVIQTGLWCATNYYITVVVTGTMVVDSTHSMATLNSRKVQVFVGGNKLVYTRFICSNLMLAIPLHRYTSPSWSGS